MRSHLISLVFGGMLYPILGLSQIIDIDGDRSVTAFYRAGLRPLHMRAMEERTLVVPGATCGFKLNGIVFPPRVIEHLSIDMWNRSQPYSVTFRLPPLTLQDAGALLTQWSELLKVEAAPGVVARIVSEDFKHGENPFPAVNLGRFKIGTWATRAYLKDNAAVQFKISIEYPITGVARDYDYTPLKPPPGYEHIPMEPAWPLPKDYTPPKRSGINDVPTNGASDVEPPPVVQPPALMKAPTTSLKSRPSQEPASATPWSIIVVMIVAALALLWLLLKRRS